MKKILFIALATVGLFTSVFAQDEYLVNSRVITEFENEFQKATNVSWKVGSTFTQASFTLEGKKMSAFYDIFNQMIGTSHQAGFDDLSKKAKEIITTKYADYTVTEVIAFQCQDENCYYVSAANGFQKLILKVRGDIVSVFKKSKGN